jgi:acyl carrier protein
MAKLTAQEVESRIEAYFSEKYGATREHCEADFPLARFLDSLGIFEFLLFIEQDISIKLDPSELNEKNFGSFRKAVNFVTALAAGEY